MIGVIIKGGVGPMVGALRSRGCSPCPAACGRRGGFATRLVHVYANFLQQGNESTDASCLEPKILRQIWSFF